MLHFRIEIQLQCWAEFRLHLEIEQKSGVIRRSGRIQTEFQNQMKKNICVDEQADGEGVTEMKEVRDNIAKQLYNFSRCVDEI
ncbi:hypothetical protein KFK09_009191 [Dendrobium nobile]|uniref:Uncharacterized protein n=1 Tax=Dendrobium nobile TaxID=94219 RepID=A0A8T3BM64_DENNO|nr:hypothetical protein KFK09_009191 [Dendrobium nobile]